MFLLFLIPQSHCKHGDIHADPWQSTIGKMPRFIGKKSVFLIPFLGWYTWLTGHIAINRKYVRNMGPDIDGKLVLKKTSLLSIQFFHANVGTEHRRLKRWKTPSTTSSARSHFSLSPLAESIRSSHINHFWNLCLTRMPCQPRVNLSVSRPRALGRATATCTCLSKKALSTCRSAVHARGG